MPQRRHRLTRLCRTALNSQFCAVLADVATGYLNAQNGESARGYLAVGGSLSRPGMAHRLAACSVYSYTATFGANVRICRK